MSNNQPLEWEVRRILMNADLLKASALEFESEFNEVLARVIVRETVKRVANELRERSRGSLAERQWSQAADAIEQMR